jgi:hypothetical protein
LYAAVARCIAAAAAELALILFCVQLQVEGHHIRVDRAAPPTAAADGAAGGGGGSAGVQYDPTRSVFVGNLDFKVRGLHFRSQQVDVPVQSVALLT